MKIKAKSDYRSKVVSESIFILENNNFSWISNLGRGTYGTVIEIENTSTKKIVAAKIVLQENLKESERVIWPSLKHNNVIPPTAIICPKLIVGFFSCQSIKLASQMQSKPQCCIHRRKDLIELYLGLKMC